MGVGQFEDKTVLVTGAAAGIGRAISHAALAEGAKVLLVDRDPIDAADFAPDLRDRVASAVVDLRDVASIDRLAAHVLAEYDGLDAIIHAAGIIIRRSSVADVTPEDFDLQYEVNLRGTFFLVTRLRPSLGPGSSIVLFTSQGWWTGGLGGSLPYSATKAGVVSLTRGFAREFAPDIRVNAVAPGFVDTAMMRNDLSEAQVDALVQQVPLGRMAGPDEIADVALFLAGDKARYLTGATLNATGGQLIY